MKNSVTGQNPSRAVGFSSIRNWDLWTLRPAALTYFFLVESAVAAVSIWLLTSLGTVSDADWLRFGAVMFAITVHLMIVRRAEESRRNESAGPHIDLTSVWTFAAAIALPGALAVLATIWMRILIQPIARRQPHRFVFSSASILGGTLLAWLVVHLSGLSLLATGSILPDLGLVLVLIVAAVVNWGAQGMNIAVALKIVTPHTRIKEFLGSRADNMLELSTLGAGAMLGMLMTTHWIGPLLLVFPVVLVNSLLYRATERRAHLERLLREQEQLQARLAEDAHTDYRTGLLNTNGLAEYGARLAERCRRDSQPVTVLAIDLDHFKRINDTWGHPAGNAVLAEVGRILREKLRPGDVAGRDGGEEFVVVLADTGLAQGTAIAERVREAIGEMSVVTTDKHRNTVTLRGRNLPLTADGPDVRSISASIGVAVMPDNGDCLLEAQHCADAALYTAKENGRNQVRVSAGEIRVLPAPRLDGGVEEAREQAEATRSA
ncbi:GGDEF domain-containing protein [Saccharothrix yanglingensis]|uniref:GGDEF domain-containing protein n=1 Tax=Saccharothrix yanglingensis TaxID=659496 RepID=A0ABU0WVJ3_9PSEU|nr:GGDEF domain-containing protein [Saccharothrix yanglingensis]